MRGRLRSHWMECDVGIITAARQFVPADGALTVANAMPQRRRWRVWDRRCRAAPRLCASAIPLSNHRENRCTVLPESRFLRPACRWPRRNTTVEEQQPEVTTVTGRPSSRGAVLHRSIPPDWTQRRRRRIASSGGVVGGPVITPHAHLRHPVPRRHPHPHPHIDPRCWLWEPPISGNSIHLLIIDYCYQVTIIIMEYY